MCGGPGRWACFYPLPASPSAQLSGVSHDTRVCELPAGLLFCSHEDSARKSACAPGSCFDRRGGGRGSWSRLVKYAGHFNLQQVNPWYLLWLLAEAVDSDALVPAKYIDGQVTLLFHIGDLRDGCEGIDPLKVQTIFGGVPSWSLWVMRWRPS